MGRVLRRLATHAAQYGLRPIAPYGSPPLAFGRLLRWQQAFQVRDVVEQRLAAALGERIGGLRLAIDEALVHRDVAGVLELAQMDAGVAVGGLDRVAQHGEVRAPRAREVGDDREPHPALQQLVDGAVVEVGHAHARRPRIRMRPGSARRASMSTPASSSPSALWRNAKAASSPAHHAIPTQRSHTTLLKKELTKKPMPMTPDAAGLIHQGFRSPEAITARPRMVRKMPQANHSMVRGDVSRRSASASGARANSRAGSRRSE